MRRPLAAICIALAVFSVIKYAADRPGRDGPPQEAVRLLQEEAGTAGKVTLVGTVADCRAVSSGVRLSVNHLTIQKSDNSKQPLVSSLNVLITTEHTELLPGDEILASGEVVFWMPAVNPGQFDARSYYFSQNTVCMISRATILERTTGEFSLARALCAMRRRLCVSCQSIFGEDQANIMSALCFGERALPGQEWKQLYQESGIAHILAISGLHISLIGMCLYRLLRRLGAPFGASCAVSGSVVICYVLMSGVTVSTVRALVMFTFWLGAQLWGRKYDVVTAAVSAAACLLFQNAGNLSQSSFLLSFGSVLSLALLVPCMQQSFQTTAQDRGNVRKQKSGMSGWLIPGIGVWLGTLPVTLYFFYQASPWSILINLAVVPLMSLLMVYGLLAVAAGLICMPLGIFLAAPSHYILAGFEFLCHIKEGLPGSLWVAGRPVVWKIALYYGILLTAGVISHRRMGGKKFRAFLLWMLCGVSCVGLMCAKNREKLKVICLDVGQGDASLIQLPGGTACLVDGGSSSESEVWKYRIGQTVKYCGLRVLDYIFLSHADEDHISGIREYLQEYEPGFAGENVHGVSLKNLVLPPTANADDFQELCELAQERGIQVLRMESGGRVMSADAGTDLQAEAGDLQNAWSITCLAPDGNVLTGDRNEDSMVLMLQYGAFHMLFTGDLEGETEKRLAVSGEDLSADILKVGHHGSANASSEEFLTLVSPQAAVISCGENNSYGHPAPETLERLHSVGSHIFCTSETGAVTVESDGTAYSVATYRKAARMQEDDAAT